MPFLRRIGDHDRQPFPRCSATGALAHCPSNEQLESVDTHHRHAGARTPSSRPGRRPHWVMAMPRVNAAAVRCRWRGLAPAAVWRVAVWRVAASLVVASLGAASPALAQEDSTAQQEARLVLQRALEARRHGDLEVAETLLRQTLDEYPWTFTAYQLADLLLATNRPADAIEVLEAAADGQYGLAADAAQAQIGQALAAARSLAPTLQLRFEPPPEELELAINDHPFRAHALETGAVQLRLNVGHSELRVRASGFVPASLAIDLAARETASRTVQLEREPRGRLVVGGTQGVVQIEGPVADDGDAESSRTSVSRTSLSRTELTPPVDLSLPPGIYDVSLRLADHTLEETVRIEVGQIIRLEMPREQSRTLRRALLSAAAVVAAAGLAVGAYFLFRPEIGPTHRVGT